MAKLQYYGQFKIKSLDFGDSFKFRKAGSFFTFIDTEGKEMVYKNQSGKELRKDFHPEDKVYYYAYPA